MKHEPKPNVEYHYHIEELINKQETRVQDREYHRNRIKNLDDRDSLIKEAKIFLETEFYCETCRQDFKGQAIKQVEVDWTNTIQSVAFYKTKCFKGHWCMRLITDKHLDRYWFKSLAVARDRGKHHNDTLQPFETGFNLLYGKK